MNRLGTPSPKTSTGAFGRHWRLAIAVTISATALGMCITASGQDDGGSARAKLKELRKQRSPQEKSSTGAPTLDGVTKLDYIDSMLEEEWKALGYGVSEAASDGEFLRRATLDLVGRIPTLEEVHAYRRDKTAEKKSNLINRLIASEEFGRNFANIWTRLLINTGREGGANQNVNPRALHSWLEREFNKSTPWNKIVTDLIASRGRWDENPAVNFVIANTQMNSATQTVSYMTKLFLCVQTQCTECHDHPWNEWKQRQFHGLSAFFSATRERRVTKTGDNGVAATDYYILDEQPLTREELRSRGASFERRNGLMEFTSPAYLDGRDVVALIKGEKAKPRGAKGKESSAVGYASENSSSGEDQQPIYLREELAKVVTAPDNPYFARAIVNRMWHHFMGHSFTKNVDDFDNGQDEPTMPDLLDKMAEDFRNNGYDLKKLSSWICNSKAYSLSSKRKGKANEESVGFFTSMLVRPMTSDQLYDSLLTLTQVHKKSKSADTTAERNRFLRQLRDTFGTDEFTTGAPAYSGTITQGLMLMNSALVNEATTCSPGTFLHGIVTNAKLNDEEKIEALYQAGLARNPTGHERKEAQKILATAKTLTAKEAAMSDVLWVILNSSEFILNH